MLMVVMSVTVAHIGGIAGDDRGCGGGDYGEYRDNNSCEEMVMVAVLIIMVIFKSLYLFNYKNPIMKFLFL